MATSNGNNGDHTNNNGTENSKDMESVTNGGNAGGNEGAADKNKENTPAKTSEQKQIEKKPNRLSEEQIRYVLESLMPISAKVTKEAEEMHYKVPSLRFKHITKHPYEKMRGVIERISERLAEYGVFVQLVENIDIKGTSSEKFYIKIEDENGSYSIMDLIEYQNNIYDYSVNEEETIKKHLLRIKGVYTEEIVEISKLAAQYISLCLSYKETFHYRYKFVGWDRIDGNTIFKYDTIYSNRKIPIEGFCGEPWAEELVSGEMNSEEGVLYHKLMELTFTEDRVVPGIILCAAASGVVRQILPFSKETNINMNIVAEKASGKSSLQHFVLSFFGNPKYLEGSFIDTDAAMESLRAERAVIPYMLDERLLRVEGDSENKKSTGLLMDIFKEYEGRVRQRYGGQYSDKGNRAYGAVISSSVESVLEQIKPSKNRVNNDLGQYRRFIELYAEKGELTRSAEDAHILEVAAYSIYGYGVRWLVEYMLAAMKYIPRYKAVSKEKSLSVNDAFNTVDLCLMQDIIPEFDEKGMIDSYVSWGAYIKLKNTQGVDKEALDCLSSQLTRTVISAEETEGEEDETIWVEYLNEYIERVKEIAQEKYNDVAGELEGSYKRFALLALTGELLNRCMEWKKTQNVGKKYADIVGNEVRFHINTDKMIEYLLDNLYDKLLNENVLYRPEKKKMTAEEKAEDYKGKITGLYSWIESNREYFFEANKGRSDCIGHYSAIKGSDNIEITFFNEMPLRTVINNLDRSAADLQNKLYQRSAAVLNDEMREKDFNEFIGAMKDYIYVERENVQRNYMTGKTKRGTSYVLKINAIKELEKREVKENAAD